MFAQLSVVLLAGLVCSNLIADEAKTERERLQGMWQVMSGQEGGKAFPAADIKGSRVTVAGDTMTVQSKEDRRVMRFKLEPSRKPKGMELMTIEGKDKGQTSHGIYQLEGDTLKIAFAPTGKPRPAEFSSKAGTEQMLFVMKRQNK